MDPRPRVRRRRGRVGKQRDARIVQVACSDPGAWWLLQVRLPDGGAMAWGYAGDVPFWEWVPLRGRGHRFTWTPGAAPLFEVVVE